MNASPCARAAAVLLLAAEARGEYILVQGSTRSADAALDFDAFDGRTIHLTDGRWLAPAERE